jgi:type II secretory pathway pseudopilin PulG
LLVVVVVGGVLWRLLPSSVRHVRTAARQSTCQNHVELLLRALYAYRNDHGSFPPCYTVDSQGKPLHSWRVLLLPYLGPEAQALYAQINLNEAWNSPLNGRFAQAVPEVFACPDDQPFSPGDTSYCVVTGAQYAFRPQTGVAEDQFVDDPATTLLIVEVHNSGINWMQPADVGPTALAQGVNSGVRGTCGSNHPSGAMVGMYDGRALPLSDRTRPDELHEMATIDGGEPPPALLRRGR